MTALAYRPPFDWPGLLAWYAVRALPQVEHVTDDTYTTVLPAGPLHPRSVVTIRDDPGKERLLVEGDADPAVIRRLFDLDADPARVDEALAGLPVIGGLGVPGVLIAGTTTPLEALLRALTGQQVTVAAGRAQLVRMLDVTVGTEPLSSPFPTAEQVLAAGFDWYAGPAARRRTLQDAVTLAAEGALDPARPTADIARDLLAVRGIGPWTVAYTLMRGYGDPDVDLSGDRALVVNLARFPDAPPLRELLAQARPWRTYAALRLWTLS